MSMSCDARGLRAPSAPSRSARLLLAAVASFLVACDPGHIQVDFVWPHGRPVLADDDPATIFLRVEERSDVATPGPVIASAVPHPYRESETRIAEVPYGEGRVMVAEVRESRDADSHVLYYGLSERFEIHFGEHIRVPVYMGPISPPEVLTGPEGGSLQIVTSTRARGVVGSADVELLLFTDSGVRARLSNLVGLPEGRTATQDLSVLEPRESIREGYRGYRMRWDLDRELPTPCRAGETCLRQVFARFVDGQGYSSRPVVADVVVDLEPPSIVAGATSVAPPVVSAESSIVVSLTTSEVLSTTPAVWVEGAEDFPLVRLFPDRDRPSTTYTFTSSRAVSALGRDGAFRVLATLTDLVGNSSTGVEVGTFQVDSPGPGLSALEVTPERLGPTPGGTVTVRFLLEERGAGAGYRVTVGGRPVDGCTSEPEEERQRVTCTRAMHGDEIPAGTEQAQSVQVEAHDEAGNISRTGGSVLFDFRAPDVLPGSVVLRIAPDPTSLAARLPGALPTLERMGAGSKAYLSFALDEQPVRAPAVTTSPSTLTSAVEREAGNAFTYRFTPRGGRPAEGRYSVSLEVEDDLGNRATRVIGPPALELVVDTTPPAAPDTLLVTHLRAPWGSAALGSGPRAAVEASPGALEPSARVVILDDANLSTAHVLGVAQANARGGFSSVPLERLDDDPEVFIAVLDGAGNVSPSTSGRRGEASLIRQGVWTASLRGKAAGAAGASNPNPHEVEKLSWVTPTRVAPPEAVTPLDEAEWAALEAVDGRSVRVRGVRRWETVSAPIASPQARDNAAAAYDSARGRGVLFGGFSPGGLLSDTWEWNGKHWLLATPGGATPPARSGAPMVYDAAHGRVFMFGGYGRRDIKLNDTWVYDGETWTQLDPPGAAPSPRAEAALAYDADLGRIVLFGGLGDAGPLGDTWIFDGERWSEVPPLGPRRFRPPERNGAAMTYDLEAHAVVLIGGRGRGSLSYADAWTFDGTWHALALDAAASARVGARLSFDPGRRAWVLFGGRSPTGELADVWENGALRPARAAGPSPRAFGAMFYDLALGETVVFGGIGPGGDLGDTWSWDGQAWRERTPSSIQPEVRADHGMVFDPTTHEVIIAGGRAPDGTVLASAWSWNGARWRALPSLPVAVGGAALGIIEDRVCLVGGENAQREALGQTLCLGATEWSEPGSGQAPRPTSDPSRPFITPSFAPISPRAGHALAYDPTSLSLFLFGGESRHAPLGDLWAWNRLTDWERRSPGGGPRDPLPRSEHGMVYDLARGRLVLFGGQMNGTRLSDLWERGAQGWEEKPAHGPWPEPRYGLGMAYDAGRGRTVMFGGRAPSASLGDLWEWDGSSWSELAARPDPDPRGGHGLAYDPDRGRLVLHGGDVAATEQLSELVADPDERPGLALEFDLAMLGVSTREFRSLEVELSAEGASNTTLLPGTGSPSPGVEVLAWDAHRGRWRRLDGTLVAGPATLQIGSAVPESLPALVGGDRRVHLRLQPQLGCGNGSSPPEVSLDAIELRVLYSLP